MKIFCLFSIEQNYDQPDNNLICWWKEKPTIEAIARAMGRTFPDKQDEVTLKLVEIWGGDEHEIDNTRYRIEEVEEGKIL